MSNLGTTDFMLEVAKGNIPGHEMVQAFGERESMGTTVAGEDIWRGNELSPAPTSDTVIPTPDATGEQMTVVSESANDSTTGGATGVQTLRIHYLDAAGDRQTEDITMDGTTGVNTVATNIRFVNDMYALTTGSGGVADDHIKIHKTGTAGLVYNMIAKGGNKSLVPHRMVPAGKTIYVRGWHASEAQGRRVNMRIRSTDMYGVSIPSVFCFKDTVYLNGSASGLLVLNFAAPALSIIKVSGWPDVAGAEVSCSLIGVMVDD